MFAIAVNALENHKELKKVVLMEHAPRFESKTDPAGVKAQLAYYANSVYEDLWKSSNIKEKIIIGKHSLECDADKLQARYCDDFTGKYDGVHFFGSLGKRAYTRSVTKIVEKAVEKVVEKEDHSSCPQAQYQQRFKNKNIFSVPVSNKYDVLGN